LRQRGLWPHPCKVSHFRRVNLPIRMMRFFLYISRKSPILFWIVALPLIASALLLALPQEHRPDAPAFEAVGQHFPASPDVLNFPQLPYQGSPAEISQNEGMVGLRLMLKRLSTTAQLMQTVAHPDDEDGGMLTLESRGRGDRVLLLTLNRGEGGQNKIGSNLSDVLGVLRTLELLAADEYYDVQERFTRVADFGFSKNAEETFAKWGGHDIALADMVRVIRTFRPDVLVARFSGTPRDGHGHHQASSILTQEAFRAAADPKRFPEQIAEGLQPWQAKKLYIGNVCGFGAITCPDANWTVRLNTGENSSDLGMSYAQFAMEGLRHQLSQGSANWSVEPGDRFAFYKLVDSIEPAKLDKDGHEKDFFQGVDTSLSGLATRLKTDESKVPQLRHQLAVISELVGKATDSAKGGDASATVAPLAQILAGLEHASAEVGNSPLGGVAKSDLLARLEEKRQQAENALNLALNVNLSAVVIPRSDQTSMTQKEAEALTSVSPGQEFLVSVTLHNGSKQNLGLDSLKLEVPAGWGTLSDKTRPVAIKPGANVDATFRLKAPTDAAYTRPYWHRDNPDTDSLNHVDNEQYATLPFPPPALRARVEYSVADGSKRAESQVRNAIQATIVTPFIDDSGKESARPLAVVPAFSVGLEPGTQVISTHNGSSSTVTVGVTSNLNRDSHGILRLELPTGWHSEPSQIPAQLSKRGEKQDFHFAVFPASLRQERATLRATLNIGGETYGEEYTLVARDDLGSFYYYQPAMQRVSIVDVKVPHDLKIGYIMGAGDDIPTVLQQIGINVTPIPAEKLATEDLSHYQTIVLGIRAYDTQKDVAAENQRLLDFVSSGGTLLVQYNTGVGDFNSGHFTPYSAELSRARVTVEEAPVEILAPNNPVFHYPNEIGETDFDGWIQERGLYFMEKWDDHFTPLLACHDPGESEQKGGLLEARYGKGIYIYAGYAFFRQLPAGVPGAVRLYVNLLSAGHEKQ
jgi:LmbE family N-acetylglucosaminyl deacetylase